jgi:hypothetical protein
MPDDAASDETAIGELPESVIQWLTEIADEQGVSQEELLESLLSVSNIDSSENVEQRTNLSEEDLGSVRMELEEVQTEFRALVDDVRDRIIQVKRETDKKRRHALPRSPKASA